MPAKALQAGDTVKILTLEGDLYFGKTTTVTYVCPVVTDFPVEVQGSSQHYALHELEKL